METSHELAHLLAFFQLRSQLHTEMMQERQKSLCHFSTTCLEENGHWQKKRDSIPIIWRWSLQGPGMQTGRLSCYPKASEEKNNLPFLSKYEKSIIQFLDCFQKKSDEPWPFNSCQSQQALLDLHYAGEDPCQSESC